MKLTINIVTDESGTMTATVPEVPGLVVEADDVPTVLKAIAEMYPLLRIQVLGEGWGGVSWRRELPNTERRADP